MEQSEFHLWTVVIMHVVYNIALYALFFWTACLIINACSAHIIVLFPIIIISSLKFDIVYNYDL